MIIDRRFAIIIGINDYDKSPLQYCVNDALEVAQTLEDNCFFKKEDIFTIISDQNRPIKDISGHFDIALKKIEVALKPQKDSVFFYFAGHGEYRYANSGLHFQDSFVKISDIFTRIDDLQPKYQCYVIDACESGGKVLSRGASQTDLVEKFIFKSSGILFMYAATETEQAKELEKIQHGLFTYYFLKAINNELIYDDGVLTPNRIQDYIARETSKESQFKQTPVIENRSAGYYPFAFKSVLSESLVQKEDITRGKQGEDYIIEKEYFPIVPPEIRTEISEKLKSLLAETFDQIKENLSLEGYNLQVGNNLSILHNYELEDKITDSIVRNSKRENVDAVNSLFASDKVENVAKPELGTFSMINALIQNKQTQYTHYNSIDWNDDRLVAYVLKLDSNDIYKVSCGIVIVVYQAIFGLGLAISSFYFDYTGYNDTKSNGPYTKIEAFKVNNQTVINLKETINSQISNFSEKILKWNSERQKSILEFGRKAK